jgi:hypothetical protein
VHSNPANQTVRMADIAAALSHALDLTEGQAMSSSGKLGKSLLGHEVSLLERITSDMNREGFHWAHESDSACWLEMEASMDGSATFDGFAQSASCGC